MCIKLKSYSIKIILRIVLATSLIWGCEQAEKKKSKDAGFEPGRKQLDSAGYSIICPDSIDITKGYDQHGEGLVYSFQSRVRSKLFSTLLFFPSKDWDRNRSLRDDKEVICNFKVDSSYTSKLFNKSVTWRFYRNGKVYIGLLRDSLLVTTMATSRAELIQRAEMIATLEKH